MRPLPAIEPLRNLYTSMVLMRYHEFECLQARFVELVEVEARGLSADELGAGVFEAGLSGRVVLEEEVEADDFAGFGEDVGWAIGKSVNTTDDDL